jgi:hypothetical protein
MAMRSIEETEESQEAKSGEWGGWGIFWDQPQAESEQGMARMKNAKVIISSQY